MTVHDRPLPALDRERSVWPAIGRGAALWLGAFIVAFLCADMLAMWAVGAVAEEGGTPVALPRPGTLGISLMLLAAATACGVTLPVLAWDVGEALGPRDGAQRALGRLALLAAAFALGTVIGWGRIAPTWADHAHAIGSAGSGPAFDFLDYVRVAGAQVLGWGAAALLPPAIFLTWWRRRNERTRTP